MAQANLTFNIRLQNYDIPYKPPNNNTFFRPNFCTKGPLFCPNFGVHAVLPCAISCAWHSISGTILAGIYLKWGHMHGRE